MFGGVSLVGVVSATFASWLIQQIQAQSAPPARTRGDERSREASGGVGEASGTSS